MRLFALVENFKLRLTDKVTDEDFFRTRVKAVRDVQDKYMEYICIRKDNKYAILDIDEYNQMFGHTKAIVDEEVRYKKVRK